MKTRFLKSERISSFLCRGMAMLIPVLVLTVGFFEGRTTGGTGKPYVVEAKSQEVDKKKPTIKFSGNSKITVEKGKEIKIPKTTAKDNIDGNITKKIKVAVRKGTKNYIRIARLVKRNRKVKFADTGNYVITYTVSDEAGNKAVRKRYITVEERSDETQ